LPQFFVKKIRHGAARTVARKSGLAPVRVKNAHGKISFVVNNFFKSSNPVGSNPPMPVANLARKIFERNHAS
jgi:hypothetical protein